MTQTTENPYLDPRFRNAWDKGYVAGSAACIQKDEEIQKLKEVLHSAKALLSIMQNRDSNLDSLLSMITEALKQ